jgi:hypothetical protein
LGGERKKEKKKAKPSLHKINKYTFITVSAKYSIKLLLTTLFLFLAQESNASQFVIIKKKTLR